MAEEMNDNYEYENMRRQGYEGGAIFIPVCEKCHRFVKADDHITLDGFGNLYDETNATCSKCGRTKMIFEGFY